MILRIPVGWQPIPMQPILVLVVASNFDGCDQFWWLQPMQVATTISHRDPVTTNLYVFESADTASKR